MNIHYHVLEFDTVLQKLCQHAHGSWAKEQLASLSPILDDLLCQRALLDATGARRLLERCGTPPIAVMENIQDCLQRAEAGGVLQPAQLLLWRQMCCCSD